MVNRSLIVVLVLILVAIPLAACGSAEKTAQASYKTLTVQQAFQQLGKDDRAVLVDVRRPDEWASSTGIPQDAVLIQLDTITAVQSGPVPGLPQDQPIYVICNSGNRSRVASDHLIKLGYKTVYNVDGGIQAWIKAGLPTQTYTP